MTQEARVVGIDVVATSIGAGVAGIQRTALAIVAIDVVVAAVADIGVRAHVAHTLVVGAAVGIHALRIYVAAGAQVTACTLTVDTHIRRTNLGVRALRIQRTRRLATHDHVVEGKRALAQRVAAGRDESQGTCARSRRSEAH